MATDSGNNWDNQEFNPQRDAHEIGRLVESKRDMSKSPAYSKALEGARESGWSETGFLKSLKKNNKKGTKKVQ